MGHGIIAWIIIGLVAGWLTGKLMKGSGFGALCMDKWWWWVLLAL